MITTTLLSSARWLILLPIVGNRLWCCRLCRIHLKIDFKLMAFDGNNYEVFLLKVDGVISDITNPSNPLVFNTSAVEMMKSLLKNDKLSGDISFTSNNTFVEGFFFLSRMTEANVP